MGVFDLDSSEFEDPAPTGPASNKSVLLHDESSSFEEKKLAKPSLPAIHTSSRPKKRKLPYRADVVLEGKRYRGRRVSRGDADLDVDTLGVLHDNEGGDDVVGAASASDNSEGSPWGAEAHAEIIHENDSDDVDSDEGDDNNSARNSDGGGRETTASRRLKAEERAVAARLAQAEKKERARAQAVKKQKEIYDAVVNMRIRIEPLISLARQFPVLEDRGSCSSWAITDELTDASKRVESVLSSLSSQVEKAWCASWPSEDDEVSDATFNKWRDAVLDRWGKKVSDASGIVPRGGFKTIDTTITAQMKAAIATGKHLERTRRVKENISLIGEDMEMEQGSNDLHFDDGDFYRTLLREIIESGDGAGGGLRYAQLSKSGKVKKKMDRSYAKGRRLKYDVHEKLVGFLTPVPLPDPGPLDEIIASMFGKRGTVPASN